MSIGCLIFVCTPRRADLQVLAMSALLPHAFNPKMTPNVSKCSPAPRCAPLFSPIPFAACHSSRCAARSRCGAFERRRLAAFPPCDPKGCSPLALLPLALLPLALLPLALLPLALLPLARSARLVVVDGAETNVMIADAFFPPPVLCRVPPNVAARNRR